MISTLEITETACRVAVDQYLAEMLGREYHTGHGQLRNGCWRFMVTCQCADMQHTSAVGGISVDAITGQVERLTDEQIRNLHEAGAMQAAKARRELARDEDGYVLQRHARIKANSWTSNHIGMKIGVENGVFLLQDRPVLY